MQATAQRRVKLTFEQIKVLGLKKGMRIDAKTASGRYIGVIHRVYAKKGRSQKAWNGRYNEQHDIQYYELSIKTENSWILEETFYEITII